MFRVSYIIPKGLLWRVSLAASGRRICVRAKAASSMPEWHNGKGRVCYNAPGKCFWSSWRNRPKAHVSTCMWQHGSLYYTVEQICHWTSLQLAKCIPSSLQIGVSPLPLPSIAIHSTLQQFPLSHLSRGCSAVNIKPSK